MLVGMSTGRSEPLGRAIGLGDAVLLLALACLTILPLLLLGDRIPPVDHDFHAVNAGRVAEEMAHGSVYPRWFWQGRLGLGEPTLLYYAPAFPLASGALTLLGLDAWSAVRVLGALIACALALSVFWIFSREFSRRAGWIGALLILLDPLALHALYFTGYWPMYMSRLPAAWLVWTALSGPPRPVRAALLLCAATLCHPLMGFMLILTLPVAALVQGWSAGKGPAAAIGDAAKLGGGLALGAALSSFYLLPALLRQDLIGEWEKAPPEHAWVFAFPVFSAALWPARHWIAPLPILGGLLVAAMGGDSGETRRRRVGFLALGGLALVLATELAWPLYQPQLLGRLQFAWRFLFVAGIGAAFALTMACAAASSRLRRSVAGAATLFWLALGLVTGAYFLRGAWGGKDSFPTLAAVHRNYVGQPEYLVSVADDDWKGYLQRGGFAAECRGQEAKCTLKQSAGSQKCWAIESEAPARLTAPVFAMEGIAARWNSQPLALKPDPTTGLAQVETPGGAGRLCFERRPLPEETAGKWISLLALAAVALLWRRERA